MPTALMPDQFVWNVGSEWPVPSLTRAMAKPRPDAWTLFQSTLPWNSETSTPSTVVPLGQTVTAALVQPTFSALPFSGGVAPHPAVATAATRGKSVIHGRRSMRAPREGSRANREETRVTRANVIG